MSDTKSLYGKLAEVTKEVGRVEKRGHNDFHNYDYVTEADLVEAVREKLADRNVFLFVSASEVERTEIRTAKDKASAITTAQLRLTWVDGDSGETFECEWAGQGEDPGDKGLYKAYTGAIKYFLMKSFLISTGDDPEGDSRTDERTSAGNGRVPPSDKQLDFLEKLVKKQGADPAEIPNIRGYCEANLTGGKTGSASKLIDKLTGEDAGQVALDLAAATEAWKAEQQAMSDVPAEAPDQPETTEQPTLG